VLNVGWMLWRGIRSRLKGEISGWPYTYANTEKEYSSTFVLLRAIVKSLAW